MRLSRPCSSHGNRGFGWDARTLFGQRYRRLSRTAKVGWRTHVFSRTIPSPTPPASTGTPVWDSPLRVTQTCCLERVVERTQPLNWLHWRFYRNGLSGPLETTGGTPCGCKGTMQKVAEQTSDSKLKQTHLLSQMLMKPARSRPHIITSPCGSLGDRC